MKFTNSPFAILDKNMNALDYQKRNLKYEDYWVRENDNQTKHIVFSGFHATTRVSGGQKSMKKCEKKCKMCVKTPNGK